MTYKEHEQMKSQVMELLNEHESAPSAVTLCFGFLVDEVPDSITEQAYNCSEGVNDGLREAIINFMSDAQLKALHDELKSIAAEKLLD